jgi:hypothetical protein
MATVTHYIYSHYDASQRPALERETGQTAEGEHEDVVDDDDDDDDDEQWRTTGLSFGGREEKPPPRFVPARSLDGKWSSELRQGPTSPSSSASTLAAGNDVAGWYKSTTSRSHTPAPTAPTPTDKPKPEQRIEKPNRSNWFIMKAIRSDPQAPSTPSSPPTLADILARDPPPLPGERRFVPLVRTVIGPSNKGFTMLQQSGWNEGEGLGAEYHRRKSLAQAQIISEQEQDLITPMPTSCSEQDEEKNAAADVIDLTLSDSDDDGNNQDFMLTASASASHPLHSIIQDDDPYAPKALLTPISTILKSDRLGIGLQAKTVGPYKASQKRVTHNAAALAAHRKAGEALRKQKALLGRGRKSFEKARKLEEDRRKQLLAYLNT